jgi:hypothetical protein
MSLTLVMGTVKTKMEINKIPKDLCVRISVVNVVTCDNTQSTQWELGG